MENNNTPINENIEEEKIEEFVVEEVSPEEVNEIMEEDNTQEDIKETKEETPQLQTEAPQQQPPLPNYNYQYPNYQNQNPNYNVPPYNPYVTQNQNNPYANQNTQNPYYYQNQNNPYQYDFRQNQAYVNQVQPQIRYNPQTGQYEQVVKEKTRTSTIVFISIISVLLVICIAGMIAFFSLSSQLNTQKDNKVEATEATLPSNGNNFNIMPYIEGNDDIYGQNDYELETQEYEITLQEDLGDTQVKQNDLIDNDAKPDENFSGLKTEKKENAKDSESSVQEAYDNVSPCVVGVVLYQDKITDNKSDIIGQGSGTVVSSDGYIITNSHVIGDSKAYKINIVFNDETEKEAKIVGYDSRTDLAVLKVDAKNLKYVSFGNSDDLSVGQDIIAIGNPGGTNFQNSLTKGIVSFVGREISINDMLKYIQIDASINPGNSGGPLCSINSQVVGINTAKISSTDYEGMGFAIPSNTVIEIANDLIRYGYVKDRVRLGISGQEVSATQIQYYNLPAGIIIQEISKDGPCDGVGIKENDIITTIDGQTITSFQNCYAILQNHKPGDKIKIVVAREKR